MPMTMLHAVPTCGSTLAVRADADQAATGDGGHGLAAPDAGYADGPVDVGGLDDAHIVLL